METSLENSGWTENGTHYASARNDCQKVFARKTTGEAGSVAPWQQRIPLSSRNGMIHVAAKAASFHFHDSARYALTRCDGAPWMHHDGVPALLFVNQVID
ncbi:MAG: hypothetical protein LBE85_05670 [Candidatus Accumulibacter sp.]|jgi:hypothetical protein|nr:hypothetical protein [Accumulibacter sp.]